MDSKRPTAWLSIGLLLLGGCATLSDDRGFTPIEQAATQRLGKTLIADRGERDRAAIDARVASLLAAPLSADDAVQIALLDNPGLQAAFDELGIADAERVQALRLPNPGFTFGRLRQGSGVEIDRSLSLGLLQLLSAPLLGPIETRRFEQVRNGVLMQTLALAAQVRQAHVGAVAAEQGLRYARQVQAAADTGAELARRMAEAGNWSALQQAREQGFRADAALGLARAEQERSIARERLTRLLGLSAAQAEVQLPERLPELPAAIEPLPDLEQTAVAQRLDVRAAQLGTEQLARHLGLTRATRFVNVLELDLVRNTYRDAPPERGYQLRIELPLFDSGDARLAKAEATYRQALHRAAAVAIDARSEIRAAHARYRSSHAIAARYRDEIVPLRQRISQQNQLRYNGMLIGVFELLADARAQIAAVNDSIEALRDFWLAQAELERALAGPAAATP